MSTDSYTYTFIYAYTYTTRAPPRTGWCTHTRARTRLCKPVDSRIHMQIRVPCSLYYTTYNYTCMCVYDIYVCACVYVRVYVHVYAL